VNRCLEKDPDRRFDDVGQLAAALKDFASAEGQRSAERSLRVASGINLKSDRPAARASQSSLPAADSSSRHLVRVPTPASRRPTSERRGRSRLVGLAAWVLAATALLAVGAAFWTFRARAEGAATLHAALPAAPAPVRSAAANDANIPSAAARSSAPDPAPSAAATASPKPTSVRRVTAHRSWSAATTTPTPPPEPASPSASAVASGAPEPALSTAPTTTAVVSDLDRLGGRY
jgi:serine/threonine-protein kinase